MQITCESVFAHSSREYCNSSGIIVIGSSYCVSRIGTSPHVSRQEDQRPATSLSTTRRSALSLSTTRRPAPPPSHSSPLTREKQVNLAPTSTLHMTDVLSDPKSMVECLGSFFQGTAIQGATAVHRPPILPQEQHRPLGLGLRDHGLDSMMAEQWSIEQHKIKFYISTIHMHI